MGTSERMAVGALQQHVAVLPIFRSTCYIHLQ